MRRGPDRGGLREGRGAASASGVPGGRGVVFVYSRCIDGFLYTVLGNQDRFEFAFLSVINHSSREVCARAWFVQFAPVYRVTQAGHIM